VKVDVVGRIESTLPADDDHPYRTGAWQPNFVEYDATELAVEGEIPDDLCGIYLRNTENPVHPSIDRLYHPFDGDGMLHAIRFAGGRASYRNRFVRTAGLLAELECKCHNESPSGTTTVQQRGGSWEAPPETARPANRNGLSPNSRGYTVGFRVVLPLSN